MTICVSRGFHVQLGSRAGIAYVPTGTVNTVWSYYCRDCGAVLTPKTLPTTEDYR